MRIMNRNRPGTKQKPKTIKPKTPKEPKKLHPCGHAPCWSKPCAQCRMGAAVKEAKGNWRERRKRKLKSALERAKYGAEVRGMTGKRLPDKSAFNATFDEANLEWTGTPTVNGTTYEGRSNSVHHLLMLLGHLHNKPKETAANGEQTNGQQATS
jgi:hypothetical protein